MPESYSDDRLIFKLSSNEPVELDLLGEGLTGLARHFRRHLQDEGIDPQDAPAKLFVTDIKTGSVEFELATLATLYLIATAGADGYLIWTQFYEKVRDNLEYLAGRIPRPEKYSRNDAKDYNAFLRTISGKRGANLNIRRAKFHQKTRHRETISEIDFNEQDIANADMKLVVDLSDFGQNVQIGISARSRTELRVPFIWYRTDREKGKASGQTSDRGIVAKVTDKPLPVYFASEIDNHKNKMTKVKTNPFDLIYLVDVAVELDENGDPKSYTILNIHDVVGEDED